MKKLRPLIILIVVTALVALVLADVPPEPGSKRVSLNIIVKPTDNFDDYRFFLKNGLDLKEYTLIKDETIAMTSMGGGALYRSGSFLAVPKKALMGLSETPATGRLNPMQKAIVDGDVLGTIELINHSFIRDVPAAEAAGWKDPVYRIEKDAEKGVKAVWVSGGANESKISGTTDSYYSTEPKSIVFWATVGCGSLLTLALIFCGVYALRHFKNGGSQTLPK